jgi:ubiquitin-like-conjugating enzyme ATG3
MLNFMKNTREYWTPALQDSAFLERGVLTPEEFVQAGDELVAKFNTWCW